jgi:hypothetical protein
MGGFKTWFTAYFVTILVLIQGLGLGSAWAEEDYFSVEIDAKGEVVAGEGTGFDNGSWYYYPNTDWWNQWFSNGRYDPTRGKIVQVDLTFRILDPEVATPSSVTVAAA